MNTTRNHILTAIAVAVLAVTGLAADKAAPAVVTSEVRVIELLRTDANKLLTNNAYVLKPETLRQLQELVDQKKATTLAQPRVTTISGAQTQVRDVRELIYPSAYLPAAASAAKTSGASTNAAHQTTSTGTSAVALYPSEFKTREVGIILNLTPTTDETGTWINVTLVPEVSQLSNNKFLEHRTTTPAGAVTVEQPDVYTWNITTSIVLKSGSTVLLAVHDPVKNDTYHGHETVVLMLLSATINRAE